MWVKLHENCRDINQVIIDWLARCHLFIGKSKVGHMGSNPIMLVIVELEVLCLVIVRRRGRLQFRKKYRILSSCYLSPKVLQPHMIVSEDFPLPHISNFLWCFWGYNLLSIWSFKISLHLLADSPNKKKKKKKLRFQHQIIK